jgi:hypothetical protein
LDIKFTRSPPEIKKKIAVLSVIHHPTLFLQEKEMLVCRHTGVFHISKHNSCIYSMRKAIKMPVITVGCGTASADISRLK